MLLGGGARSGPFVYDVGVLSDSPGVLVFAEDPQGRPTVVVVPDGATADDVIACLEYEGWEIIEPTYDADVEVEDFDEDEYEELDDD